MMEQPDPRFPPLLKGHAVEPPLDVFAEAWRRADCGEIGAGDILWSRRPDRLEAALILEPEVSPGVALQMIPLAQVALADALGGLLPPKVAIHFRWPGLVLLNGGVVGEICAHLPSGLSSLEPPPWLGIAIDLLLWHDDAHGEPGERAAQTAIAEEGGTHLSRTHVLEAFASYFLMWLNKWTEDGFRPVHDGWLFRAEGRERPARIAAGDTVLNAQVLGLDEEAGLLVKLATGEVRCLHLLEHLRRQPERHGHA